MSVCRDDRRMFRSALAGLNSETLYGRHEVHECLLVIIRACRFLHAIPLGRE